MSPFETAFRNVLETFKTEATADRPLVINRSNKPFMITHAKSGLSEYGYANADVDIVMVDNGEFVSFTASKGGESIEISIKFTDRDGNVVVLVDTDGDSR